MKNLFLPVILIASMISFSAVMSQNVIVSDAVQTEAVITQNDYSTLQFKNRIGDFDYINVKTEYGLFSKISVEGYGFSMEEGKPQLPVLKRIIEIPEGAVMHLTIPHEKFLEFDLGEVNIEYKIFPVQPSVSKSADPEDIQFIYDQQAYQTDKFYSVGLASVKYLGVMRGVRMALLEISPFLYNPVTDKLEIYTELDIRIDFEGGNVSKTVETKKMLFSPYFESIYKMVSNFKEEVTDELIMDEPVTYVIVSDPMFESTLQPFIEWKIKKGFNVIEAYTDNPNVGTTTTSIKAYLLDLYNNPAAGYNPQSFVLFVGDVAQIPAFIGTSDNHVTDLYYCEYTSDIFPECYYGRFSAETIPQLQPQIDKTLEYEKYLMPDPSFLDEVVMVAGADASHQLTWGNGQINYGTTNYFNAAHGILSHTYLQPESTGGNYSANIQQNVSDGVSYANYTAHCSPNGWANPGFGIGDIAGLSNAHKYCLMVGNCCSSLEFQTTCFGEEVLRAQDKGALGYIGGSNSTYWDEDFWWGVGLEAISANPVYNSDHLGAYDRTFHDNSEPLSEWYVTQGQMPSAGNLAVTQSGSTREIYYWEIYHLMGDPSVMIYMSQPPVTNATYTGMMPLGATSFTVNTEPYGYVAISKDGVLHGAAVANASGVADVTLTPITIPGTADVVVTRQNGQPYMGTVMVASPSGPYLSMESCQIDDNAGNNNGEADFDETIALDVNIENIGSSTATTVSAVLSSTDSYVTITDNSNNWPDIAAGGTSLQMGAFSFDISDDVTDQHVAEFDLEMTDGIDIWNSAINITINAPLLEADNNIIIDDVAGGNGNGRLDPGETVDISIVVSNNGHSNSPYAVASLSSVSPYVVVNSSTNLLGVINAGSFLSAEFNILIDASTPLGTSVDFLLNVDAGNYDISKTYYESVGLVVEDWESAGFSKFPWSFGGDADWTLTTTDPYEGIYSAKSGIISHSQSSELLVTLETTIDDTISFYRRVSSESGWDKLFFYIDGTEQGQWSGEVQWEQVSYPVIAGVHTFKWIYDKDGSVSSGSDCGWIDFIVFPPIAPVEPDIAVDPLFIDFGEVSLGSTSTETFTISNSGSAILSGTINSPVPFTVSEGNKSAFKEDMKNTISFTVNPGSSEVINITFAPTYVNCFSDNVYVLSNDPNSPSINVAVTGCGVVGPVLSYSPGIFEEWLAPEGVTADILSIDNNGDQQLNYTAQIVYTGDSKNIVNVYPGSGNYSTGTTDGITKTEISLIRGQNPEDGWFKFNVSTIPVGATINSIELYGYVNQTYFPYWSATSLPMDPVTALGSDIKDWVEAHSATDSAYYYGNESSSFATGWHNWILNAKANTDLENSLVNGWFAIGMDSRDYSTTYYIVFDGWNETNPPYLVVDYTYNPPYEWLTLDGGSSISGVVDAGGHTNINVGFDAGTLEEGVYTADIYFNSNDPDEPLVIIPVTLNVVNGYNVNLTVFLEGPFNYTGMNTNLQGLAEFPQTQPFNTATWNYSGAETISGSTANVVDWVLVELRDAVDAQSANVGTRLERQAGLLLADGSIVSADGISQLFFTVQPVNHLFAVVYSRNHLAVISASTLTENSGDYSYDFSNSAGAAHGTNAQKQLSGIIWGMYSGDGNGDGHINNTDLPLWKAEAGKSGYKLLDYNFDGQVDNVDKDDLWFNNNGIDCQVPE